MPFGVPLPPAPCPSQALPRATLLPLGIVSVINPSMPCASPGVLRPCWNFPCRPHKGDLLPHLPHTSEWPPHPTCPSSGGPCEVVAETQSRYALFCSFFIVHWWVSLGRSPRGLLVVTSLHILPTHPDFLNWKLEPTFPRWPHIEVAADHRVPCRRRGSGDSSRGAQHLFLQWSSFPCPVTSIVDPSGSGCSPQSRVGGCLSPDSIFVPRVPAVWSSDCHLCLAGILQTSKYFFH